LYEAGYNSIFRVVVGDNTLALTAADHGGRIITVLDPTMIFTVPEIVVTEPRDKTDPGQVCNLGLTFRFLQTVDAAAGTAINLSGSDKFIGSIMGIDTDTSDATLAWAAAAGDNFVSIDYNGGTLGGLIGTYTEITAVASAQWLVSGQNLQSGVVATPFVA
tara:strand:+ start:1052 stop:1534 length:483 start_codon:yes stop_codon:yes gene_type:complete